ncbi:hypothetical protein AYO21_10026 [Fonsecaea monophora]|uniref:Zn(2)-C6 fungal-type domain-containing protein n=1 Tax=Fonsecaea monophora TaxID=254056 RepID=A0A177EXM2_9EURO|nr:hypothetical protein AYO21_10026 [Fonsecaea monophora]OAG35792.1 hypothetical protein AYO21_10026 [Fonsecaea monophora]
MASFPTYGTSAGSGSSVSNIACCSCRRRKVKCTREIPQCGICLQTNQACEYPASSTRPGPKIGSTQQARKRKHGSIVEEQREQDSATDRVRGGQATQPEQSGHAQEKQAQQPALRLTPPSEQQQTRLLPQPQPHPPLQSNSPSSGSHAQSHQPELQPRRTPMPSHMLPLPQPSGMPLAATLYQASSPSTSVSSGLSRRSHDIQSLSFIMHPSHERLAEDSLTDPKVIVDDSSSGQSTLESTCHALGLAQDDLQTLVDEFFDTFPSFQLFHRPTFWDKLQQIKSKNELNALVAAILIFAFRDQDAGHDPCIAAAAALINLDSTKDLSQHFGNLAEQFAERAMLEYSEQGVPLSLLQAMILINHWQLIRSVRGKSWRYLGVCIRCAYEMNLHAVDKGVEPHDKIDDVDQWREDEEKRRAWWAIWEMDVFASVVRRCPTGIDWSCNETFLPAPDKNWFLNEPQESCYLDPNIVHRWKKLRSSGNKSYKAWFLVVDSIVKDAQNVTQGDDNHLRPIKALEKSRQDRYYDPTQIQLDQNRRVREAREGYNKVSTLHNVLECAVEMMPAELRYRNQFLNFSPRDSESPATSTRLLHQEIYTMHMVVQLARLMIYKYFVFRGQMSWIHLETELAKFKEHAESGLAPQRQFGSTAPNNAARQCFVLYLQASQSVVNIIQRTPRDHYKFVNPFLANTIWLATAVQILKRELLQTDNSEKQLTASNAELLRMTYLQFESYWGISSMLEKNLSALEVELNNTRDSSRKTRSIERDLELSPRPSVAPLSNFGGYVPYDGPHQWREPGIDVSRRRPSQARPASSNHEIPPQTLTPPISARDNAPDQAGTAALHESSHEVHHRNNNNNAATTMTQRIHTPSSENGRSILRDPRRSDQNAVGQMPSTTFAPDSQSASYHVQANRSLEQDPFLTGIQNDAMMSNSPGLFNSFNSFFSLYDGGATSMGGAGELSGTLDSMMSGAFV